MHKPARYLTIARQLTTEILAGKYQKAGRLPSEVQLVKRFRVSRPTVGQALRCLQDDGLIERRPGSGTYLSTAAPRPARNTLPRIGMIVPSLRRTEIFEQIIGEIATLVRAAGYDFWPGVTASPVAEARMTVEEAERLCGDFISQGVKGVFLVPFEHQHDREAANRRISDRLRLSGISVVLIDRDLGPFPSRSAFDLVGVDNFLGGYQLVEHLLRMGLRRFAYVVRPLSASTVDARIAGARAAMAAHQVECPRHFVFTGDPADIKFVRTFAKPSQLDAILCASDHTAAQILQTLSRLHIRVPADLRVVGFDNVPFAGLLTTPLTTVEQSCRDIAVSACEAMNDRLLNPALPPRSIVLTPRLVVRESCGACQVK
jgi:LacI family transcriptional regulator